MIYRIFEHMVHESMRLESFNTCINPVNLVNPVENAICGASCKYSQSATQFAFCVSPEGPWTSGRESRE